MKKIIALILVLVMLMTMCACCAYNHDEQIAELQREIASLKKQIAEQSQTISEEDIYEETVQEGNVPENSDGVAEKEALLVALTNQVNSGGHDNMYAVAKCDYATELHLKAVAQYASKYDYEDLASEIEANRNTTAIVMETLLEYINYDIYELVAKSNKASESALIKIAQYASKYNYENLASAIEANPNTTATVMEALLEYIHYDIYELVAISNKASESALIKVAQYAAKYGYEDLAIAIEANPNTTASVMEALLEYISYDICEVVAKSNKAGENALIEVASYASDRKLKGLASIIVNNPSITLNVLTKLSESRNSDVANLAHEAIESWNK